MFLIGLGPVRVNNKGQTGVEYILMVAILALVIISLTGKIKVYLLGDDGTCANPAENKSFICQTFKNGVLTPEAGYRTFKLLRFNK